MENTYCIYCHTSPSGKRYIGQTKNNPEDRWRKDGSGYKKQEYFYKAIQKYGWENFEHEILEENLTVSEVDVAEQYYIRLYNSYDTEFGYNRTLGGQDNHEFTDSVKEDISNSLKEYYKFHPEAKEEARVRQLGKVTNGSTGMRTYNNGIIETSAFECPDGFVPGRLENTCIKIRNSNLGKVVDESTKIKISTALEENTEYMDNLKERMTKNNPMKNPDTVKKVSESRVGKYIGTNSPSAKKVICIETNEIFNCIGDAQKKYKNCSKIGAVCNGRRKTSGGYHWQFYKEEVTA